ncbi:hypothetical protein JCGZ_17308 [Jatropha curcas]|uniref:CW-type domain-containing protein n=1 Tax=Jatropha curcas TaxID=180498 RepID=A0A067LB74_JATCU|nr:hypothetical protein JCGZ_17308 [Jatropha curcas]
MCLTHRTAYENSVYCDTYHLEESGWRECYISEKIRSDEIPNGFGLLINNACDLESTPLENRVAGRTFDEGKLAQLCRLMEANAPNLLCQSEGADTNAGLGQFRQEEVMHQIVEASSGFSAAAQSSAGQSKFAQPSIVDIRDIHGSHAQPSLSMSMGAPSGTASFAPYPCGVVEGKEQSKTSPFQQGQRSRPIFPKPSKPVLAGRSETNKVAVSELRIARPPAAGRGKNKLLPRYWPRITDQELQQLSGDLNSNIVPLFEKVPSASDAGRIGRLVLPKACAESYFPPISESEGLPLRIQDSMQLQAGDTITFSRIDPGGKLVMGFRKATNNSLDTQDAQTSTIPNSAAITEASFSGIVTSENHGGRVNGDALLQSTSEKKRTRNIGPKNKRLLMNSEDALELRLTWEEAQDLLRPPPSVKPSIVAIEDHEFEEYDCVVKQLTLSLCGCSRNPNGRNVLDSLDYEPPVFGKRTVFADQPSGGQEQWAQCDDCSKWRKLPQDALLPPKWTCSDNVWDSSRCSCSAPEEMSLKDLDYLLRVSKDLKKRRIVERRKASPECERSGLDALASAAVLGDNICDTGEPSVGDTTKHPRHRPGCTCIVCIQPPSGKGKHKPTCTCNVCMTVKHRFKTLVLHKLDNERNPNRKQTEVAETSAGQIDLNCHPNREDIQMDIPGLSIMDLADAANMPFDNYIKENGLSSLMCDRQASLGSCSHSQSDGENLRRLSDEAFLASIGWDRESRGD